MSHTFKVGEIAEIVYSRYHDSRVGSEVIVVSGLQPLWNRFESRTEYGYVCRFADGGTRYFLPDQLRKKRPPQDWVKLCNLQDKPVDAPTRELECA